MKQPNTHTGNCKAAKKAQNDLCFICKKPTDFLIERQICILSLDHSNNNIVVSLVFNATK